MTRRRRSLKSRRGELDGDAEVELTIGPGEESVFADDGARRAAWFAHRDELLAQGPAGSRPWGFWQYESGLEGPPPVPLDADGYMAMSRADAECAWLAKHGKLTVFERRQLEEWRKQALQDRPVVVRDEEHAP